ncbi:hypothetical protein HJC23_009577 [Cyclotella cryptica]|uniref:VIR protein n=1 Tax=Cyclotella cryptica TaxID=29204 RepID=A0ABD3PV79_9STRA
MRRQSTHRTRSLRQTPPQPASHEPDKAYRLARSSLSLTRRKLIIIFFGAKEYNSKVAHITCTNFLVVSHPSTEPSIRKQLTNSTTKHTHTPQKSTMMIHQLAISALLLGTSAAAKSSAKQRNKFMAEMKSANLSLHPSERHLTKDQTPSLETFSDIVNGNSDRSKNYRKKILSKAKYVSPEEVKERERNLQNYYANGKYNYNNGQGVSSLYSEDSNGDSYVGSGTFSNAFGFDPTDYSFAYLRCAEVRQFDDELAAEEDSPSVFSTKHFAVFRFCPTTTCEGMTEKQIEAERQEEYYAYVKSQNQAYAESQMAAYSQANNGNAYNAYNAQNYVKQQAEAAQQSGASYEPPSWVFDKRIIGGADGSGCSSNYGEYLLELEDYLAIMLEYHADRFEVYCDYCDNCMYAVYQQWIKSQGRKLEMKSIDQDWKDDLERHLSEEEVRKLGNVYNTCPEYDTCKYYKNICQNGLDDTLTQYFECTEVQRNNGIVAYVGPHCASDGKTVTLGVYSDEDCNEFIGQSTNINNYLGFQLDEDALDGYVTGSLARDVIPDDYYEQYWSEELQAYYNPQEQLCIPCAASLQIYENKGNVYQENADDDYYTSNNEFNDEVNDLCINMYLASSLRQALQILLHHKQKRLDDQLLRQPGSDISGNILTNSIYYEEYGHYVQEVSPLQIFGLVASLLACAILGIWSATLARSLATGKAPWRPRRGVSNAPASASAMERNDSGIVLGRSATMERGRSTSSYYMT